MTLDELNELTCEEGCLDASESAIIRAFRKSGLEGILFTVQYGAGGITFRTRDNRNFYVMLENEYDKRGYEITRDRNCLYRLIELEKDDGTLEPPIQTLDEIFKDIAQLISNNQMT